MAKKKIIRLTESELVRLVEKVVKESNLYGGFPRKGKVDYWVDLETDTYIGDDEVIRDIEDDELFDTEEFDTLDALYTKHPNMRSFDLGYKTGDGKDPKLFDSYRRQYGDGGKFRARTRRPKP
jgi:hypothetical protein